jgi:polo-like kinase 1
LVVQFVDFSSKYGLGYKLSNGSYGVLFNDSTKIIMHPNMFHFDYIERNKSSSVSSSKNDENAQDIISQYNFFEFPENINKKVVLLQHFKSYLDGNQKFKPIEFAFSKEDAPTRPV